VGQKPPPPPSLPPPKPPGPPLPAYTLIAPSVVAPGQTVLVRGAGFPPGQKALVTVAGRPVAQALTTSYRKFVTGFVVQSGWPRGTVRVVSQVANRQVVASLRILSRRARPVASTTASTGGTL